MRTSIKKPMGEMGLVTQQHTNFKLNHEQIIGAWLVSGRQDG